MSTATEIPFVVIRRFLFYEDKFLTFIGFLSESSSQMSSSEPLTRWCWSIKFISVTKLMGPTWRWGMLTYVTDYITECYYIMFSLLAVVVELL